MTPHEKALTAAMTAFNQVVNEPQMIKCDRCDGKGYHHGFGEDGASPDWCLKCGGNQFDVMPGEEERAMQAAISAYLSSIGGIVCAGEPTLFVSEQQLGAVGKYLPTRSMPEGNFQLSLHAPIQEAGNGADSWLPIETAPKDGTQIDLWGINLLHFAKKGERIVNVAWGPVTDWMGRERDDWQHGRGGDFQPTHWRPLPLPPSPSNEGEKP